MKTIKIGSLGQRFTLVLILILVMALIASGCAQTVTAGESNTMNLKSFKEKTIFMYVGSPLILSGEDISFLDPEDFDVAATVYKQRTLVPLRAVAEYFGAEVSYDGEKHEATINYGKDKFVFPIDKPYYLSTIEGSTQKVSMDTEALLIKNRTMVPIRVVAEQLLNKKVDFKDQVILISEATEKPDLTADLVNSVKSKIGMATKAKSLDQLNKVMATAGGNIVKQMSRESVRGTDMVFGEMNDMAAPKDSGGSNAPATESAGSTGFSKTNTQVDGIDEADIVKTDGKYIYYGGNNALRIIKAQGAEMEEVGIVKLSDDKNVQEIYVDGNRLVIIGNRHEDIATDRPSPAEMEILPEARMIWPGYMKTFAFADVYDIEKPEKPTLIKSHEMEGYYQSSRKSGDNVYLITNNGAHGGILPLMRDTARSHKPMPLEVSDIMVMPMPIEKGYVILSAIDISDNSKTEVEAVTAFGANVYMNLGALYISAENYKGETEITKFKIDGTNIGYAGSGKVKGSLLNQFSMDEFKGNLRVATTEWEKGNNLFVLNESLNEIGSVTGLAKDERIYSVRFMGDKGYIVTFRNIDPLFVFDLSDPTAPKVTGELKIPGFSNYLHPVGEDLILGLGMETRELFERDSAGRENPVGFRQGGLKVSLFDVSDMGKPKEIGNLIIGETGSYSEALYNHKAIMVDPDKGLMAFDAYVVKDKDWKNTDQGSLVISYKDGEINQKGLLKYQEPEVYGKYIPSGRRTLYIADTLYYIQDGIVSAYDYHSLEKLGTLILK